MLVLNTCKIWTVFAVLNFVHWQSAHQSSLHVMLVDTVVSRRTWSESNIMQHCTDLRVVPLIIQFGYMHM